jgi:chromosome segregation ATPase
MNPLLFPPTLIKRALDDLGAIADAARRLPTLEEEVIQRIDRVEHEGLGRIDALIEELRALRVEMAPIQQLTPLRKGIEPLDDDMRAVRESVDNLEPLMRELSDRLEAMRQDVAPLATSVRLAARRSLILLASFPPASAKSGRPPPPPPTMGASCLTT